jgi:hypothetical protein
MSRYCVVQAHNGLAAQELYLQLLQISLPILNTYGTGIDVRDLIRRVRVAKPGPAVLQIGSPRPAKRAERCAHARGTVYHRRSPARCAGPHAHHPACPDRARLRMKGACVDACHSFSTRPHAVNTIWIALCPLARTTARLPGTPSPFGLAANGFQKSQLSSQELSLLCTTNFLRRLYDLLSHR